MVPDKSLRPDPRPQATAEPWRPTVEDIVSNAQAAIDEARRHVAAQSQDSNALDTKAAALITIASGLFALAVTRVHLGNLAEYVASGAALLYFVLGLTCCFQAIRPRSDFSNGADPSFLAELAPNYPHWSVMHQLAIALGEAREKNLRFLGKKQGWYEQALVTAPFLALGVTLMVYTGALA
jgi:hypothetical protein